MGTCRVQYMLIYINVMQFDECDTVKTSSIVQ
jgi:hypothetical protein